MTEPLQRDIFADCEGNGWHARNRVTAENYKKKCENDLLLPVLADMDLSQANILEIGASNGWRLASLKERFPDAACHGLDPSAQAVADAWPGIAMRTGSAEALPYEDESFDLVIYGFCLYLCDRRDLYQIAEEGDRVLREGGHIAVYDFHTPRPYKNPYVHQPGLFSYKMDYSRLFSWNPAYSLIKQCAQALPAAAQETDDNRVAVSILRKDTQAGWPDNPFKPQ